MATFYKKFVGPLIAAVVCVVILSTAVAAEEESSTGRLKEAVKTLMLSPADGNSLQAILDYARNPDTDPHLKSLTMAVYALSALSRGDTNLFARAKESHDANYPADKRMIPFTVDACCSTCDACGGAGYKESQLDCTTCGNTRRCRRCNGTGKWQTVAAFDSRVANRQGSANIKCNQCGGSGCCAICNGESVQRARCTTCNGSGAVLTIPQAKISSEIKGLLGGLIMKVDFEDQLAERIALAKAETNLPVRITLLTTLQKDLRNRPEALEIERLLLVDQQTVATQKAEERQQADILDREIRSLRGLKNPADPKAAIATLSEYLASHPDSPHKIEIQSLLNDAQALMVKQKEHKKIAYAVGAAILVLLGISSLNISFIRYNILPSSVPRRR